MIGDAILDVWQTVQPDGVCREAPADRWSIVDEQTSLGGAANTAINLARLARGPVELISGIGPDAYGRTIRAALNAEGITLTDLAARRTPHRTRVMHDGQLMSRFDGNADGGRTRASDLQRLRARLDAGCDVLIIANYGTGSIDPEVVRLVVGEYRSRVGTLVVDSHDVGAWAAVTPDVITPDVDELCAAFPEWADQLLGQPEQTIERHAASLLARTGARWIALTRGADGAIGVTPDGVVYAGPTHEAAVGPFVGAGDVFAAAVAVSVADGHNHREAITAAISAASEALPPAGSTQPSTTVAVAPLLRAVVPAPVDDLDELRAIVSRHRAAGQTIALTNGCFDLLHAGHISVLEHAASLADVLVVAMNSDASVRALKGPGRPIVPEQDRARVLLALGCVTHVHVFPERTIDRIVDAVAPDVYVKGGDYTLAMLEDVAKAVTEQGGRVVLSPYVSGRSTSGTVSRIEQAAAR